MFNYYSFKKINHQSYVSSIHTMMKSLYNSSTNTSCRIVTVIEHSLVATPRKSVLDLHHSVCQLYVLRCSFVLASLQPIVHGYDTFR